VKPKHLLHDYLNGRISGEELRTWLAKDTSEEARETLQILNTDDGCRNALKEFAPAPDAPQRLAERVVAVDAWVQAEDEAKEAASSKEWFFKLVPAMDVVGHSKPESTKRKSKKPQGAKRTEPAKKTRSSKSLRRGQKKKK
jgi:hypothetical protein